MADLVLYVVRDRVAHLTLNRPDRGNGLTRPLLDRLEQLVEHADLDPAVHVLMLAGRGKGFCGGYDLGESAEGHGARGDGSQAAPKGSQLDPAVIAFNHNPAEPWDPMVDYGMM